MRDLLCFFQERPEIDVEVDGLPAESAPSIYEGTSWLRARWVEHVAA